VQANHELSRVSVSFDETKLVPNAGLLPAAVLAQRIDLGGLVDVRLKLASGPSSYWSGGSGRRGRVGPC
jgi:hypothetical protein